MAGYNLFGHNRCQALRPTDYFIPRYPTSPSTELRVHLGYTKKHQDLFGHVQMSLHHEILPPPAFALESTDVESSVSGTVRWRPSSHERYSSLWAHIIYNKSKILSREMIETVLTNNSRKRHIFKPTLIPWKTIKGETACTFPNTMSCLSLAQFAMVQAPEMSAVKLISQCERKPNNGTLW